MSCLVDLKKKPHWVEEVSYMMARLSRKQEQTDPGTKDEAFLIKMTLIRRLMTNFKRTVRANCAVSVGSLLPLFIRALAP